MNILDDLLPKKIKCTCNLNPKIDWCECGCNYYNQAISDCRASLEKAMKEGKICVPASEEEIGKIIQSFSFEHNCDIGNEFIILGKDISNIAQALAGKVGKVEADSGNLLFMDLCHRLINRILEFNPNEHDIELNLCGIIEKAKVAKVDVLSEEEIYKILSDILNEMSDMDNSDILEQQSKAIRQRMMEGKR